MRFQPHRVHHNPPAEPPTWNTVVGWSAVAFFFGLGFGLRWEDFTSAGEDE